PWVGAIADAVPGRVVRRSCAGDLPENLFRNLPPPRALVIHRATLAHGDADRLARWRCAVTPPPRVVLCVGPMARHAEIERWAAGRSGTCRSWSPIGDDG